MSKFIVASLASAFVLTAAGSLFAAGNTTPAPAPTPQAAAAEPAAPPTAQLTPAQAAAAAKKKSDTQVICKPDSGTGSRVGGLKICMTREEWRHRDQY
ncbi:MAG TPA: hypothetical protein VGH15_00050 [Caulobacteraceae bacterium]